MKCCDYRTISEDTASVSFAHCRMAGPTSRLLHCRSIVRVYAASWERGPHADQPVALRQRRYGGRRRRRLHARKVLAERLVACTNNGMDTELFTHVQCLHTPQVILILNWLLYLSVRMQKIVSWIWNCVSCPLCLLGLWPIDYLSILLLN